MSLSKKIIYGSDEDVINFLNTGPSLDVVDEYGYTPLIQAAIVNSISKVKSLLKAGAKADFTDITGRTALFWAADNDNSELCKLLLEHKANPNAYSSGAQPILVMPLMKQQTTTKKLLLDAGASLTFAQDFLNAKLIGHSFELEGRVDIVDTNNTFIEVELEGFYLRFTLEIITSSLVDYKKSFAAKKMRPYFEKLEKIIGSLQNAIELIRMQHYLLDIKEYTDKIDILLGYDPLILPISFGGHAVSLIKFSDQFVRCDRGEFGATNGSVIYYDIQHQSRLTKSFCRDLIYKRQYPETINTALINYLGLRPQTVINLPLQKTGNCSWANVEAVIPAIMYLLLMEENPKRGSYTAEQEAIEFYHDWREWNKTRSLDFCIQSFNEPGLPRKISKAALLAAVLFQACDHASPEDRQKSNKILEILLQPEYKQILVCYAKTFSKETKNELWKNFYHYLEEGGIDINSLLH